MVLNPQQNDDTENDESADQRRQGKNLMCDGLN